MIIQRFRRQEELQEAEVCVEQLEPTADHLTEVTHGATSRPPDLLSEARNVIERGETGEMMGMGHDARIRESWCTVASPLTASLHK